MRRFVVSGLVPCDPVELADRLLDPDAAPRIWPQIREHTVEEEPDGWSSYSVAAAEDAPEVEDTSTLRLRRAAPAEVQERSAFGTTVHRFLPAKGGCLWSVESHAERQPRESWQHFVRRRRRDRMRAMALVDTAAGYFASLI
jgi:hypothetical protein